MKRMSVTYLPLIWHYKCMIPLLKHDLLNSGTCSIHPSTWLAVRKVLETVPSLINYIHTLYLISIYRVASLSYDNPQIDGLILTTKA